MAAGNNVCTSRSIKEVIAEASINYVIASSTQDRIAQPTSDQQV
ncbi:hypothetical protein [Brevundimonas sp. NIBR10]|nr:hypothetical protein [Brevundimonas sp. NIBR10]